MFSATNQTATESATIWSTAREMMFFTKTKRNYFRFSRHLPPKVRDMTASNNLPPPGPWGWTCHCGCPRGSNKSNWTVHQWLFRKSEASFPWLVQTVCLLLAVVSGCPKKIFPVLRALVWSKNKKTTLFLNYTLNKRCENQKKIDRQLVMSRTSLRMKHVETGLKNTGNALA